MKRKSRCDAKRPKCSTCAEKAIACCYPTDTTPTAGDHKHEDLSGPQRGTPASSDFSLIGEEIADEFSMMLAKSTNFLPTSPSKPKEQSFEFNDLDIAFANFINDEMNGPNRTMQHLYTVSQQVSVPTGPSQDVRSIIARARTDPSSQRTIKLIMHTLKSFLRTMQHDHSLPPFIHPRLSTSIAGSERMDPMANCMSLMQLLNSEARGSRKLFWKNVRLESERLLAEARHIFQAIVKDIANSSQCTSMTRVELLGSMQALSIYIFVRLDEGQTEDNDFDEMLQATVSV